MTTIMHRESAKILAFPNRFRMPGSAAVEKPLPDLAAQRSSVTACGSSWYHDAAIQEAKQSDKS